MTRPLPSPATLAAIADAFDGRDRRSNGPPSRPRLPTRPIPFDRDPADWPDGPSPDARPPLSPAEMAGALRGMARDIDAILSRPSDLTGRELTLVALSSQLTALALLAEGRP
jgi:hypothetical protein